MLLELEGTGGSAIPYLGYVEIKLHIPGIRGYNEDILLLIILTMTLCQEGTGCGGVQIIDRTIGIITKGELAKATMIWRQAHFGVVMSGSLQLPHRCAGVEFIKRQPYFHNLQTLCT